MIPEAFGVPLLTVLKGKEPNMPPAKLGSWKHTLLITTPAVPDEGAAVVLTGTTAGAVGMEATKSTDLAGTYSTGRSGPRASSSKRSQHVYAGTSTVSPGVFACILSAYQQELLASPQRAALVW